jgi:hypothetical protein
LYNAHADTKNKAGVPVTNRSVGPSLILALSILVVLGGISAAQMAPGSPPAVLAPTPVMGWNSWNKFGCDVSEKLIREIADGVVNSGMRAAGYHYVNIDDCWQVSRQDLGTITDSYTGEVPKHGVVLLRISK